VRFLELKKPVLDHVAFTPATQLRVVQLAPSNRSAPQLSPPPWKVWNSFFARMVVSLVAVGLPFLLIAGLLPNLLARWGVGPELVATVLLIGMTGIAARFMIRPVTELSRVAALVESGDLSARVVPGGSGEMRQLGHTFNAMLERLTDMLFRLRGEVAESGDNLAAAAEQLAGATLEQTTAASQTSSSMEGLSRSTVSIADTAAGVAAQARDVRTEIATAQEEVKLAGERVAALAQRVGEIEAILGLINDIADQTNLLALNAAIEAARAGETGRGFAVVADEVRRLAERSKAAAAQIGELVKGALVQSQDTVTAVETRSRQLDLWLSMMETMAAASSKVQVATEQQRSAVENAVFASEHIAESSRSVAETAQQISLAASRQGELAADIALSTDERISLRSLRQIDDGA
jgi:methyl-accepting chemotaxis protein